MNGHGQDRMVRWSLLILFTATGCGQAQSRMPAPPPVPTVPAVVAFDPASAGSIRGRVTWAGAIPAAPPYHIPANLLPGETRQERLTRANPNLPAVDGRTRAVRDAVVFLRDVDPAKARPWPYPPVRVEQRGLRLHIRQGEADAPVGFVHRGDAIEMVSKDPILHALHAGGANFFTLAFPDPDQPCSRRLQNPGLVELSSGAGYYWMRAYLFVDDHPYYARTDAQGRFALDQVPPGRYQVVAWLPNWQEARHERDPESGLITRLFFRPPVEQTQTITINAREARAVDFVFSTKGFSP